MLKPSKSSAVCAMRMQLAGSVQGIGYRPALARLAQQCGVNGWVRNTAAGVEVHIEGTLKSVARFTESCEAACPENGSVRSKHVQLAASEGAKNFAILSAPSSEVTATIVPRDIVVCEDCLREVTDSSDRRHGYLLTSCSSCGPRYSIIERMPYERPSAALASFPLCRCCLQEYQSPPDRRFHAQSTACGKCGPILTGTDAALDCLSRGKILAIKGLGGYQLLVDAKNGDAIARLRKRKGRMSKPFAVIVANCTSAGEIAELNESERSLLASPQGSIVVLRLRPDVLPGSLAPNLRTMGVMLPTSPLHAWLVHSHGPLVVTSGNIEGAPLEYEAAEARCELASVADHFVDHNRPIVRPIDDSVTRVIADRCVTLRLARGLAPLPIHVTRASAALDRLPHILALGAHQKVAIALYNGHQAILGPHIGDLDTLETRARLMRHISDMLELYGARPSVVVHDAHADYFTSQWAEEYCGRTGARRMLVQHHHAHIVAGMVEHGWLDRRVLGVAWDGTGLGSDGTLWGGEFLSTTATGFEQTACLKPLALPGGEAAIRQPWRIAAAMLCELQKWDAPLTHRLPGQSLIAPIVNNCQFSPLSTSAGRLFDAVATLVLPDPEIRTGCIGYEGHYAAMLEDLCNVNARGTYPFPVLRVDRIGGAPNGAARQPRPHMLDWRPLMRGILRDLDSGIPREDIAMRFHRSLAAGIKQISCLHPELPVVLGGGVFQNKVLVELIRSELTDRELALPGMIPAGDGGLAAGQLAIAYAVLEQERCV